MLRPIAGIGYRVGVWPISWRLDAVKHKGECYEEQDVLGVGCKPQMNPWMLESCAQRTQRTPWKTFLHVHWEVSVSACCLPIRDRQPKLIYERIDPERPTQGESRPARHDLET